MAIAATCGHCGVRLRFKDEYAGRIAKCRACEQTLVVQGETIPNHDVFLSYSSKDKPVADAICAALESKKTRCWVAPRDILAGKPWAGAIIDAIEDARVMVLVFSANSNASPQVLREVDQAVKRQLVIIPFRIDDTALSKEMDYYISAAHWLDAIGQPTEAKIGELVEVVRRILSSPEQSSVILPAISRRELLSVPPSESVTDTLPSQSSEQNRSTHPALIWSSVAAMLIIAITIAVVIGIWIGRKPEVATGRSPATQSGDVIIPPLLQSPARDSIARASKVEAVGSAPTLLSTALSRQPISTATTAPSAIGDNVVNADGNENLLAKVRLPDDVVNGIWQRTDAGLESHSAKASLVLPYHPSGTYDLQIAFSPLAPTSNFWVQLPYGTSDFSWHLYHPTDGDRDQITIGRWRMKDGGTVIAHPIDLKPSLTQGKECLLLLRVQNGLVECYLDNALVGRWHPAVSDPNLIGLDDLQAGKLTIVAKQPILLKSMTVRKGVAWTTESQTPPNQETIAGIEEVDFAEKGTLPLIVPNPTKDSVARSESAVAASQVPAPLPPAAAVTHLPPIELLSKVRFPDDAVSGEWRRTDQGMEAVTSNALLILRYKPAEEYDVKIKVCPTTDDFNFGMALACGNTNFHWQVYHVTIAGKDVPRVHVGSWRGADGRGWNAPRDLSTMLQKGQTYDIELRVRQGSIESFINGAEERSWTLDSPSQFFGLKVPPGSLGISAKVPVLIKSALIIPHKNRAI